MGYRNYFYKVEKSLLEEIHQMTKEEFIEWGIKRGLIKSDEEEPVLSLYEIGPEFFGFGSYYENAESVQQEGKPLFSNKELAEWYDHYEPYIVGKDAVLNVIQYQQQTIIDMYEKMLFQTDEDRLNKDFDERTREQVLEQHVQSMYAEWKNRFQSLRAIDLRESSPEITTSWKYEYSIFELVRLYKATDWNKYGLLFMGW